MDTLLKIVKLTRPLNLAIIALTMWLMMAFVLRPFVQVNQFELQLPDLYFWLLVLSTVLIAAAGNVINDYFDQRTDRINKPRDIIVGVHVKRRVAMFVHQLFNIIGLGIAVFISWKVGIWKLSIIHFFAAGSLWFYSVQFKRELIIGNVLVALLAAMVPVLVGIYEIPLLIREYGADVAQLFKHLYPGEDPAVYFKYMFYFIFGYAAFAFMLNLIREIQKDMADVKGDRRIGSQTIPLVFGIKNAKRITAALIVLSMIGLLIIQQMVVNDLVSLIYLIVAVFVPLSISLYINHYAVRRPEFVRAGNAVKIAMLGGLLYSIVHYYVYFAADIA